MTQIPPRDERAEDYVLGACLVSRAALSQVIPLLEAEDFYFEANRKIYAAIRAASRDHEEIDDVVIRRYADEATREEVFRLIEGVPTASNAGEYAREVKEASLARRVLEASDRIKQRCFSHDYSDAPAYAMGQIQAVSSDTEDEGVAPLGAASGELRELIAARREGKGITGIPTGIKWLDRGLHGLNPGCSYIIAARPGVGKSLVIGQIALHAAYANYRVLLQSPEMSRMQYLDRLAHGAAGVDYERAQNGKITDREESDINAAAGMIGKLPLFVDDYGTQTAARARANVMRHKPDLLLVDYIQYMTPDDARANRNQQVGQVSRDLTRIKSDFHIPVVLAAQLNRDIKSQKDKRPALWDLRDSGELEQDADAVVFLHRESRFDSSAPEDEIEFLCQKFRNGGLWHRTCYLSPGANWVVSERGARAEEAS